MDFIFHDLGLLLDGDLRLELIEALVDVSGDEPIPTYRFRMLDHRSGDPMGGLNLRLGTSVNLLRYRGNIGFTVEPPYRGHGYAGCGCLLVLPLARRHGLASLWITCDTNNIASRKTCERIGARLVEVVDVPEGTEAFRRGARAKCRYELLL
jgi:tagatose 1,6-diphosphate aldolase